MLKNIRPRALSTISFIDSVSSLSGSETVHGSREEEARAFGGKKRAAACFRGTETELEESKVTKSIEEDQSFGEERIREREDDSHASARTRMEDGAQGIGVAVEEGQLASEERPRLFPVRRRSPWIRAWRGLHDRGGTGGSCQSLGNVCQLFGGSLRDRDSTVAVDRRLNTPRSNSPSLGRGWRARWWLRKPLGKRKSSEEWIVERKKSGEERERGSPPRAWKIRGKSSPRSCIAIMRRGIDRFEFSIDSRIFFEWGRIRKWMYSSWNGRVSFPIFYKNRKSL